jgi:hypothetical protein
MQVAAARAIHSMRLTCSMVAMAWLVAGCAPPGNATHHGDSTRMRSGGIAVGTNVDISQAQGSQDEVSAAIDPADPSILLAGSNSLEADASVRVYGSMDSGAHWTSQTLPLPTTVLAFGAVDQWAAIGPDHRQAMAYLAIGQPPPQNVRELAGLTLYVATRADPRASWEPPAESVGGLPPTGSYDDKPMLVADNGVASPHRGWLYVAWTRWQKYSGVLLVSHSADWGHTWSAPVMLSGDGENWGASLAVAPDGALVVAWAGSDQLWIARSADGGATFSTPVSFDACRPPMSGCVDGANIPAQTDAGVRANPSLARVPGPDGRESVLAVYANGVGGHTRIEAARFDATALRKEVAPSVVPLGATSTDQFLPAVAYDGLDGKVWVCAYVSLVDARVKASYTCVVSRDGGARFGAPAPVASVASDEEQPGAFADFIGRQYGDYSAVVAGGGLAHAFWTDSRVLATYGEEIYTATLH